MTTDKTSTREKAAAARKAAEASEKRRERTIRILIAAIVVLAVGGILGATLWSTRDKGTDVTPDQNAPLPTGVAAPGYGVAVGTATTPVLDAYEDFQCPACAAFERAYGATIDQLVAEGKVQVVYHPMNFLDRNLGNDSSTRAAAAFGCAVNAGATEKYHNVVFANQPQKEGAGYTQEQLKQFGVDAGITGPALDTFNACVDALTYKQWPTLVNTEANQRGVTGTPTFFLNGQRLTKDDLVSAEALTAKITAPSQ